MNKQLFLEDLLARVEEMTQLVKEKEADGEDLSVAHDLLDELADELYFRLE